MAEAGAAWVRAVGGAAADAVADCVARVEEVHRAIAGRSFAAVGPGATAVRATHDGISTAVYRGLRGAVRIAGRLAGAVAAHTPLAETDWSARPRVAFLEGAIGGAFGDHLEACHPALAPRMAVRLAGRDVALDRRSLAAAFPRAEARVAVFLHGLCETEAGWGRPALDDDAPGTYGDRLRHHLGHSPVFLRYNSGLHVSENGRRLATLLGSLAAAWPVELEELVLVGHSMGGLVVRSACAEGERRGMAWVGRVRHCIYLGTPHDGAPLERAASLVAWTLRRLPETRALATAIGRRSAGINDLGHAYLCDEDWTAHDPERPWVDAGSHLPLLATSLHHAIAATVGATPQHLSSRLLGDTLVLHPSAHGRGRRGVALELAEGDRHHVGGLHHFALLDHPLVYERLRSWLAR